MPIASRAGAASGARVWFVWVLGSVPEVGGGRLAERKCYNDTWLWEEYLGLTSSFSSLACYLSGEAVLMHVYIF